MASPLIARIARFAASPQGRRLAAQAKDFASKPENRAKIEQARQKLVEKGRGRGGPSGSADAGPGTAPR